MEIFIDLLYCIEKGERLKSKKSKLKAFREWLCDKNNRFNYFSHILLSAYHFDRKYRSPEVHGYSTIPSSVLKLEVPTFEENNSQHGLTNTLMNSWRPLIDLLNNKKPNYMQISEEESDWLNVYLTGTPDEVAEWLEIMFENIE